MRFRFHAAVTLIILTVIAVPGYAAVLGFHVTSDTVSAPGFVINTITVDTDADLIEVTALSILSSGWLNQLAGPPFYPDPETASPVFDLSDGGLFDSYVQINDGTDTGIVYPSIGLDPPFFNSTGIRLTYNNTLETDIGVDMFIAQLVYSVDANGPFGLQAITATDEVATVSPFVGVENGFVVVPEPGTAVLLGAFGVLIVSRRRTR